LSYRILIVDDSPAMQGIIARVIHLCGLAVDKVLKASNGSAALSVLENHPVDLIVTDINMPQSSGEDLVRHLARHERLRSIPVIVVSTDSTDSRVKQMMGLGAKAYLPKPFTAEQLKSTIEQVLGAVHA
jgi:two-component system chemotaxis response regulator CheY